MRRITSLKLRFHSVIFAPFDREGKQSMRRSYLRGSSVLLPVGEYGDDRDRLTWMLENLSRLTTFPDIDNLGEEWNDFFGEVNVSYEQAEQWDDFFDIVDDYVTRLPSLLNILAHIGLGSSIKVNRPRGLTYL